MAREIEKLVGRLQRERNAEADTFREVRAQIASLIKELDESQAHLAAAAELLGDCMPDVSEEMQETIAEEISAWPLEPRLKFGNAERAAREGEAGAKEAA